MANLNGLTPATRAKAEALFAMCKGTGFVVKLLEGFRTQKRQACYHAQGCKSLAEVNALRHDEGLYLLSESENEKTITNCDGINVKSKHQSGKAIDVVPIIKGKIPWNESGINESEASRAWQQLGQLGKAAGFSWGGDWGKTASKFGWDCPHFELPEGE